jgi:hypothetical protein
MTEMLQEVMRRMETEFRERAQAQQQAEGLVPVGRKGIIRRIPIVERETPAGSEPA